MKCGAMCWLKNLEASQGKRETALDIQRARRDQRRRQATPDVGGSLISKGTYISGLSSVVDHCIHQ